jgi:beta-lactamase regulating signal transducer with metallopeptidase domain
MESLAIFLVKSVVGAGVLFFFYILALRGRKFHRYNRFYLLGALLVSLIVPLINFRLYSFSFNMPKEAESLHDAILARDVAVPGFSPQEVVLYICIAISVLMMVCLLLKIMWVYRMIRNHEVQRMDGYYFIESGLKEAPFTFLDKLFWKKTISLKEDAGQKIFAHELVHIREKHTYDKLFSQFVLCFFWMNPFYWFIQRELNMVHEFLADAKSIKEDDVASFAEMLLRSHNDGSYLDPVHPFFNSSVKRRLDMIKRSGEPGNNYLGRLAVLPIVGFIIALFSFSLADMELPGNTFHAELTSLKMTAAIIHQDSMPVNRSPVKNDAARNIANPQIARLKTDKSVTSKKSYKKETDQKEAMYSGEDKLAGIEKRAELQKSLTVEKGKSHGSEKKLKDDFENSGIRKKFYVRPSVTKESLKPFNSKGIKPAYFSEKQKSETRKFQSNNEKYKKPVPGKTLKPRPTR